MNKKYTVFMVTFVLSLLIGIQDSNASLFNWRTEYFSSESTSRVLPKDWSFGNIFNKSENLTENKQIKTEVKNSAIKIQGTYIVQASGYSSTPDQTDSTPFTTASGSVVRDGTIATNFLPFGTTIRIPDVYGDRIFVVEDRMNKRYRNNIDIWFPERDLAKEFGRKNVKIEIIAELEES